MCTVTFIPSGKSDYVLTQNRDVSIKRPKAQPPEYHDYNGLELLYPVDVKGGGTWNAVSPSHHAFLLNGADYQYYPDFDAPKSRGSLCLEVLADGKRFMEKHDFRDYDDFTLLRFSRNLTSEIDEWKWNGAELSYIKRPVDQPYMWISRGMYSRDDYLRKSQAFRQFLKGVNTFNIPEVMDFVWSFHHQKKIKKEEGFLILRPYDLGTVSVFQVAQQEGLLKTRYEDRVSEP